MKPSSRPPRTPSRLSESVHHQLNMYALAASAAGVGMLALAQPAEAKIVYTPLQITLGLHGQGAYKLDINHDRITDFYLLSAVCSTGCTKVLLLAPESGNSAIGYLTGHSTPFESALKLGSRIGPGGHFLVGEGVMHAATSFGGSFGPWGNNVKNRYLGLAFVVNGNTHYGWARLTVRQYSGEVFAFLTGYAYETIPNKPIIAGKTKGPDVITVQPASLGHLAAGASAIPAWRTGK